MQVSRAFRIVVVVALVFAVATCARGDDSRNVPLGQQQPAEQSGTITGPAKVALDSANVLFRARAYDQALAQYRRSAELAPAEVTPLLGVLMVAEATGNTQLAQATMAQIQQLDPAMDSAGLAGHGRMVDIHKDQIAPQP